MMRPTIFCACDLHRCDDQERRQAFCLWTCQVQGINFLYKMWYDETQWSEHDSKAGISQAHKSHFDSFRAPVSYGDLKVAVDVFWCRPFGRGQNWSAQVYWKQCDKSMFHPRRDIFNSILHCESLCVATCNIYDSAVLCSHIYFIFVKIAPRWQCFVLFRSCARERSRSARFPGFCRSFQNAAERSQRGGRMQGIWLVGTRTHPNCFSWNRRNTLGKSSLKMTHKYAYLYCILYIYTHTYYVYIIWMQMSRNISFWPR